MAEPEGVSVRLRDGACDRVLLGRCEDDSVPEGEGVPAPVLVDDADIV